MNISTAYATNYSFSLEFAQRQDKDDPLNHFRQRFLFPQKNGKDSIYLCGNSLGLQPKSARDFLDHELTKWAKYAVDGHFHATERWYEYHKLLKPALSEILGAQESELAVMNNLSSNLHFMLVSFYQPKGKRTKILMEAGAFPSDQYVVESQVRFHGYDPEEAIIEVAPRQGESSLRNEDILAAIAEHADELALVMFAGIQYYTGQLFDMQAITKAGHAAGAFVGFDLAHAAGNVPLQLHDWGPDFAAWCSYKYLNSGPGNISGVFVHERHANNPALPRFAGWWGHDEAERFQMKKGFKPQAGADGWMVANSNILPLAAQRASLEIFREAGMQALHEKSLALTGYLEYLLREHVSREGAVIKILTPSDPQARGCQLSLYIPHGGKSLFNRISEAGVICDYREPNVIRIAPTPLYNTFTDVYTFAHLLQEALQHEK